MGLIIFELLGYIPTIYALEIIKLVKKKDKALLTKS